MGFLFCRRDSDVEDLRKKQFPSEETLEMSCQVCEIFYYSRKIKSVIYKKDISINDFRIEEPNEYYGL